MQMTKYKVGDRIQNIDMSGPNRGKFGKVYEILYLNNEYYFIKVRYEDGEYGSAKESEGCYKIIKTKTTMQKLGTMMKKLLDKDTQLLVKAGFINGDLELTEEGRKELLSINFEANKAKLVDIAKEKIAEEKEENKD